MSVRMNVIVNCDEPECRRWTAATAIGNVPMAPFGGPLQFSDIRHAESGWSVECSPHTGSAKTTMCPDHTKDIADRPTVNPSEPPK